MIGSVYIPTDSAEDWKRFLADPEKQWRSGYSAKETAEHWERSKGLPRDLDDVLRNAGFENASLLLAIPEWKTPLPGGRRESQSDVFALVRTEQGLLTIAVEAKVAEPFGPTVGEWRRKASDGKRERLKYLKSLLGLTGDIDGLRYQLLHRTVSSLIEADNFDACCAAMIVQSFHPEALWRDDVERFLDVINLKMGQVGKTKSGKPLLVAWSTPAHKSCA